MKITTIALTSLLMLVGQQQATTTTHAFAFNPATTNNHKIAINNPTSRSMLSSSSSSVPATKKLYNTQLSMAATVQEEKSQLSEGTSGINVGMIGQSLLNQALIGSTIWSDGPGAHVLSQYADFLSPEALGAGLAGFALLTAFSRRVETSESPAVAGLNLSTELSVLRLFGSKQEPVIALLLSILLGGVTGVVEETMFRGLALPNFAHLAASTGGFTGGTEIMAGAVLSTLLFAILHTNPLGFFKGGDATKDNAVLLGFQLVTGSIFAALFLSTGNLAVPILAHALYDTYTFYATHMQATGQIEYAETQGQSQTMLPSATFTEENKWILERGEDFVNEARKTFYLMDTNRDGTLSRKELRVALFSYGIDLSKMESSQVLQKVDTDRNGSIDFKEFLEFIGPTGSTSKAIKNFFL